MIRVELGRPLRLYSHLEFEANGHGGKLPSPRTLRTIPLVTQDDPAPQTEEGKLCDIVTTSLPL
jgi:hypothetical protein